ncbi:hypothetical protein BC828DRAFT_378636 [Blastocladiella britannica]|nr:hypothetical protein BC828DRAFT_378636 [Blastocladiella britannica]
MNSLIFLVLALLATIAAANPVPNGGPSGLPPNDAAGSITYSGGGSAYVAIQGDYGSILKECRGLQGTSVTYRMYYTFCEGESLPPRSDNAIKKNSHPVHQVPRWPQRLRVPALWRLGMQGRPDRACHLRLLRRW